MEKKPVLIYGAGGVARDIINMCKQENNVKITGIIDDNKKCTEVLEIPVFTLNEALDYYKNGFDAVIAIGDPFVKEKIFNKIRNYPQIGLANIVSRRAIIFGEIKIGKGNIIYPLSIIASDVELSNNILICGNVSLGHDCRIGDFSTITFNSTVGGNTFVDKKVYIGSGSHIREGIKIGKNSVIGMGSTVIKTIEENKLYYNKIYHCLTENNLERIF